MTILLLSDPEAYYMMMYIIHNRYGYYEEFDDEDFDYYTSQLCGMIGDRKNKKMIEELKSVEKMVNQSKRFIQVILTDFKIVMDNKEEEEMDLMFFYKIKLVSSLVTVIIHVKSEKVSYISTLPYKARKFAIEDLKIVIYQKRVVKSNLFLIKKLVHRFKKIEERTVPLRSISVTSDKVEFVQVFNDFSNGISFKVIFKFCKENIFQYVSRDEKYRKKFFSDAKYCSDFENHLKLYKYISSKHSFDQYAELINIVMNEHRFQTDLLPIDDKECLDLVRDEEQGKLIDLTEVKLKIIERRTMQAEKKKEFRDEVIFFDHTEDILFSVLKLVASKQMIDTGIDEKREMEFKVHPSHVCVKRLKEWTLESNWSEKRFTLETPFTEDMIEAEFLDDFDLTKDDTCIWTCKSIFGYPFFVRIHTSPSFFFWNLDSWIRRWAIFVYSNHIYRAALNMIIVSQFMLLYWSPFKQLATKYDYYFLMLYTFDFLIASIGKGFILNEFAYMSDSWNFFDTFVTLFAWLQKLGFIRQFLVFVANFIHSWKPLINNYNIGIGRFLVIVRISRLIRDVRNILYLQELRTIISVLINLIPKMIPMLILIILILMCISTLMIQSGIGKLYYNFCWPLKYNLQEMEMKLKNNSSFFIEGFFDYDFYPCSKMSYIPFVFECPPAEQCQEVSYKMRDYIQRFPIDNITYFNQLSMTWVLLLMLINAENYDPHYYILQAYLGIIGFIINATLCFFGFYVLTIFLGIISDTYEKQIEASREVFANIKYHENEAEFSHDVSYTKVVLHRLLKESKEDPSIFGHRTITIRTVPEEGENEKALLLSNLENAYRLDKIEHKHDEKASTHWVDIDKVENFFPILIFFERIAERILRFNMSDTYSSFTTLVIIIHGIVYLVFRSYIDPIQLHKETTFLSQIESIFTVFYVFEILLNLFCYGRKYYHDIWHAFDLFIVICNIIYQFDAFGSDYLLGLTYLRLCRILRILVKSWNALRLISIAVSKSFGFFITTILVFVVIFIYLGLLTNQLFDSIKSIKSKNLFVGTFAYQSLNEALFTVFAQLFMALWQDALFYYIQYDDSSLKYEELLPFSFEIFIVIAYFGHLIFRDLFIPQLLSNVAISKLVSIQEDSSKETYQSLILFPKKAKKKKFKSFFRFCSSLCTCLFSFKFKNQSFKWRDCKHLFKKLGTGLPLLYDTLNYTWLKSGFFFLNIVDSFYTLSESYVPSLNHDFYLYYGLLLKLMLSLEIVLKIVAEGVGEYFYGKRTGLKAWKIFRSFVEIFTVLSSFISIFLNLYYGYHFLGRKCFKIVNNLSYLRLIDYSKPVKLKVINFLRHIKGIFNIFLFCSFIILICDIIGLQIFLKNEGYCLLVDERYGTTKYVPVTNYSCEEMLKDFPKGEMFYHHKSFNFRNIGLGFQTIIQLIYGDSFLFTVQTLINYERSYQNDDSNIWAWSLIILIIFIGPIVDALIFLAISEVVHVEDVFDEQSLWGKLKSKQSTLTYLAISKIKYVTPWSILDVSRNRVHTIFLEFLSSPVWDNVLLIVIAFNLTIAIFEITKNQSLIPDFVFLIIYFTDGLFRFAVVGTKYFKYPFLFFLDFIWPTILIALHIILTDIKQIRWSLLIFLRLIAPDRYIKFKFLSRSKIIISAIISSIRDQLYIFASFIIFVMAFANIGLELFHFSNIHGTDYVPFETPLVYKSFPAAFTHLFAIGFGHFFDIALIDLEIRSKFCLKKVNPLNKRSDVSKLVQAFLNQTNLLNLVKCQNQELSINKEYLDYCVDSLRWSIRNLYLFQATNGPVYLDPMEFRQKFDIQSLKLSILLNLTSYYQHQATRFEAKLLSHLDPEEVENPKIFFDRTFCSSINSTFYYVIEQSFKTAVIESIKFESLKENCSSKFETRCFYFIFMLISKLFFLNFLKSIVMKHYGREKQTVDIDFSENDIAEYIQSWHKFAFRMGKYGNYLPLKYAYFFIRQEAPFQLRLTGKFEEHFQLVMVKYKLPVRNKDMFVHAFDLFAVAVASNFDCPPDVSIKDIVQNLLPYILRIYPDYQINHNQKILMPQFIAGYYFGTIAFQAIIQKKVTGHILIEETNIIEKLQKAKKKYANKSDQN